MDTFGKFINYLVRLFIATVALFAIIMAVFRVAGFFAITTVITFVVIQIGAGYYDYLLYGCIIVWMVGGFIAILGKRFVRFVGFVLFASAVQTTFTLICFSYGWLLATVIGLIAAVFFTTIVWWITESRDRILAQQNQWNMVIQRDKEAHH